MSLRPLSLVLLSLAGAVGLATAQSPPDPKTPSAAHERLTFFEGTWTVAGATPENDFRETCAWLPEGRRHMVCRARWRTPAGAREGMSIFSYDPQAGQYLYHGFRGTGAVTAQRGNPEGGGWRFVSESGEGARRTTIRATVQPAEGGFELRAEESTDGTNWTERSKTLYRRLAR